MTPSGTLDILRWAAGADVDPASALKDTGRDALLALLARHQLSERFLERLTRERPPWGSTGLRVGLWTWCRQSHTRIYERQLAAIREIAQRLPAGSPPLIVVKGFSTFALTEDRRTLGYSADMDIFFNDLELLRRTLLGLGYGCEMRKGHEFAALWRGDIVIELHHHFPVFSYPEDVPAADLVPAQNPGRWTQRFTGRPPTEIRYEDLLAQAYTDAFGVSGVAVADPAMAVLILCAHEFREYIHAPARFTGGKFGVWANIADLVKHPGFRPCAFLRLVDQFEGRDTMRFAGALLERLLGENPLPMGASESSVASCCPQMIARLGGWADLGGPSPEGLLDSLDTATLVQHLGSNTITATVRQPPHSYSPSPKPGEGLIGRVVVQTLQNRDMAFRLAVLEENETLAFHVAFSEPLQEGREYFVSLYCYRGGPISLRVNIRPPGAEIWGQEGDGTADVMPDAEGCVLRLSFPISLFERRFPAGTDIPMTLTLACWPVRPAGDVYDPEPAMPLPADGSKTVYDADPVIVVPLTILRDGSAGQTASAASQGPT